MIEPICKYSHTKIPGIFHDNSPENQKRATQLLNFLISYTGSSPKESFTLSIFRDSIVSTFLNHPESTLEEIILEKAPFLKDYPEELQIFITIADNDLQETMRNRSLTPTQ
jgi:hypothetical protein